MKIPFKKLLAVTFGGVFAVGTSQAAIIFSDDFESPDVTAAQSDGNTSGAITTSKWVRSSNGFGSTRQGTVDEAHGDFTDPVGEQAYAFRYTNSGITTTLGSLVGTFGEGGTGGTYGSLGAGSTITVTFDVVMDGHNNSTPYNAALVTFADGVLRNDTNGGIFSLADGPSAILDSVSGNAIAFGDTGYLAYQQVSFTFTVGDTLQAGTAASTDDLALRFYGATSTAIIDNVSVDIVAIPEPGAALLGGFGILLLLRRRRA